MNIYDVIKKPIVTEKGVDKKDSERTLCFEVNPDANKAQVKQAVEALFKVKVAAVRTATFLEGNQSAPPGTLLRIPVRLEESLRTAQARAETARVRGDIDRHGNEEIQSGHAVAAFYDGRGS